MSEPSRRPCPEVHVDASTVAGLGARRFAAALLEAELRDRLAAAAAAAAAIATAAQPPRSASQKADRDPATRRFETALAAANARQQAETTQPAVTATQPPVAATSAQPPPASRTATTDPATRRFETALAAANARQQAETARSAAAAALTQSPGATTRTVSTDPATRRFEIALAAANARREASAPEHAPAEEAYSGASPTVRRFNSALRTARSPGRARATGPVRVTVSSDWTGTICRGCKHTIRVGDLVQEDVSDETAVAIHDMPDLPCHSGAQPLEEPPAESVFAVTLRAAVQRVRPFKVNRLLPGHPLLNGDYGARKTCPGCGHTFRPFERIARCPCSPAEPGCSMPAHRDPAMHQFCFDFLADPQNEHCQMDWHKRERTRS